MKSDIQQVGGHDHQGQAGENARREARAAADQIQAEPKRAPVRDERQHSEAIDARDERSTHYRSALQAFGLYQHVAAAQYKHSLRNFVAAVLGCVAL